MIHSSTTARLAAQLRSDVATLRPGDRLPPSRELVRRHRVSPVTLSRALATLAADGLISIRPGAGTYVTEAVATRRQRDLDVSWQTVTLGDRAIDAGALEVYLEAPAAGTISLAGGYLHPSLVPSRALTSALGRAIRRPDVWERPPLNGLLSLRSWFAASVGVGISAEDVIITSGGQAALSVALRSLLPAGAALIVESPTYPGVLAVARAAGVRPVPVPVDADGMRSDLLVEALRITGARAVYLQPTYQNPTGAVLSAKRRSHVLKAARESGSFIIEDDYARCLSHEAIPPPPLISDDEEGRVVHIASLTKPSAPSMRIGALIARGPVAARLRALRVVDDLFVARFIQEAAVELVTAPAWQRHLSGLTAELRGRRQTMMGALAAEAPELVVDLTPRGGMHIWVRLPDGVDELALVAACRRAGVLVSPGRPYFAAESPAGYLRLSFSGAARHDDLREAVRRVATALA